jgi:cell division septation protein DedD
MSLLQHGRRALGRTLLAAANQQSRAIGGSAGAGQAAAAAAAAAAQPQPVDEASSSSSSSDASPSASSSLPRWRRELGVVRNDWT